ncbi:MAG: VWA domain-containing protein [Pirellulales bacterium]|nr:VWA domain-containing protein [Pirellulales bacterium]
MLHCHTQFGLLLAETASAGEGVRELVVYEFSRLSQFDDGRMLWLGLAVFALAAIAFIFWFYRRESLQGPRLVRWLLPGLRLLALAGAVLFFLGPEKRIDQQIVTDSEVVLLVDTSQSMSIEDESNEHAEKVSRSVAVAEALADSPLVAHLREEHDVSFSVFDEQFESIYRWKRDRAAHSDEQERAEDEEPAWVRQLQPQGAETRLGDALKAALDEQSGAPLAGLILFSDGGHNNGFEPLAMAELAGKRQLPLHTVGGGSTSPRRNLRVQQLNAPARVYPEDKTTVKALIQAEGFAGRSVRVELFAREAASGNVAADLVGQQQVAFDEDSQVLPLAFQIEPAEIGRLALELRIDAPTDDQYAADNRREVEMEVVEAQTRVMLIASGATRDYRFLRNQLRRDRHATVDIWLQSALPGISQDADKILDDFPHTKEQLYPYDCIVAFDPDWGLLDARQVELLESWVAEQAGGIIMIAGPIHTASWVQSPEHAKIRALYPVEFQKRLTLLDDGLYGSKIPWPIAFTRDGEESSYLWLADSIVESRALWSEFTGVFGCYAVKGPKPGARVLGRYSDPEAGISTERPVYLAEHFYGSGRVFYMGSGELWRLRRLDVGYFEILYTNLIRHVSQGRILRGSSLGQLLLQRDRYSVGDDVVVRAQLSTLSREPLLAQRVTAHVVGPQGIGQNLVLRADEDRPGNFVGQFSARSEGSYRIELPLTGSLEQQLVKRIQVTVPDLEFDKTRRNETLLKAIATRSGGKYYANLKTVVAGSSDLPPVSQLLTSRAESKILRGTPSPSFTETLNRWLLGVLCGALCLEWLLRRLMRLA